MDDRKHTRQVPEASSAPASSETIPVPVTITDPLAMRALAHKVRLDVIDELFSSQRSHTATELARRFGLTPSAMSYHLRALEKWGYVVRAAGVGDGRERYWRAAGSSLNVGSPGLASDLISSSFIDVTLGAARDRVLRALRQAEGLTEEAKPFITVSNDKLELTRGQAQAFSADFQELVERYRRNAPPETIPPQETTPAQEAIPARETGPVGEPGSVLGPRRPMHVTLLFVPEVPPDVASGAVPDAVPESASAAPGGRQPKRDPKGDRK